MTVLEERSTVNSKTDTVIDKPIPVTRRRIDHIRGIGMKGHESGHLRHLALLDEVQRDGLLEHVERIDLRIAHRRRDHPADP